MKRKLLILLISLLAACGVFAACVGGDGTEPEKTKLTAPKNLVVTGAVLKWDAVENAAGYRVRVDENAPVNVTATETAFSLDGLTAPGAYQIRVQARGGGKFADSDWSQAVTYTVSTGGAEKTKLAAPQNLAIDGTVLSWGAVTGASGYVVVFDGENASPPQTATTFSLAGLTEPGAYQLRVKAKGGGDFSDSDWSGAFVYTVAKEIPPAKKILIIEGAEGEGAKLDALITAETDFEPHRVRPVQAALFTAGNLAEFSGVVLVNVSTADLTPAFTTILDAFVRLGGGLLTTGGDKAYWEEDFKGSALAAMLPVEALPALPPFALVIVIDSSTSTCAPVRLSAANKKPYDEDMIGSRLWAEAEGAKAAVNALEPDDYVGIIDFNSNARTAIGMTPATRKTEIFNALNSISTSQGTVYGNGVEMAARMLGGVTFTSRKHVLFMTDGIPLDGNQDTLKWTVNATIQTMNAEGITFSTVGIGNELDRADARQILQSMADDGWGIATDDPRYGVPGNYGAGERHFLGIRDIAEGFQNDTRVTDFMRAEVEGSAEAWSRPAAFRPTVFGGVGLLNGINAPLPELGNSNHVRSKESDGCKVYLETSKGLPLYAEWDYGSGRAASFMSTLGDDDWSRNYFTNPAGKKLILNMIDRLIKKEPLQTPGSKYRPIDGGTAFMVSKGGVSADGIILSKVFLGLPVTEIAHGGFRDDTRLVKITLPDSITAIGGEAFAGCTGLTGITIPVGVETIGIGAFQGCNKLKSIAIPGSVINIAGNAFTGCTSLAIYAEAASKPYGWSTGLNTSWNLSRPVVWGCTMATDENGGAYVESFTKSANSIANPGAANGISVPSRAGYTFGGWATAPDGTAVYTAAEIASAPDGTTLYAIWVPG
ncbi:MAG: leucine-rich repeat protein [Firmicutes bacterium]|nr:leucine-rich repeat protein [Bacillota bacterium]